MFEKFKQQFTPQEYVVTLLFAFVSLYGLYSIVAWMSYSPIDSAWSVSSTDKTVLNKMGIVGAWSIDLFLTLFGYAGNLFPFILFLAPIYLIRTKLVDSLTITRFMLRMFGLVLLLYGIVILAAILLPNQGNYLSGGVFGSMASQALGAVIGKFGTLLLALFITVIGIVLCSGKSLVMLVMSFYHWITSEQTEYYEDFEEDGDEQIIAQSEPQSAVNREQVLSNSSYSQATQNLQTAQSKPSIRGLNQQNVTQQVNSYDNSYAPQTDEISSSFVTLENEKLDEVMFPSYNTTTVEHLPTVTITQENAVFPHREIGSIDLPTQHFSHTLPDEEQVYIPPVSLESLEQQEIAQRHLVPQSQSPKVNVDIHAQVTPREKTAYVTPNPVMPIPIVEDDMNWQAQAQSAVEKAVETPNYKGYADTLIHPLLQQPVNRKVKPITPLPTLDLLEEYQNRSPRITEEQILDTSQNIEKQLRNFNIKATVQDVLIGPVVTRYDIELQPGVKASKVSNIDTDLARALMFRSIRVTETIPGKPYIGIETPNEHRQIVSLRSVLDSDEFRHSNSLLSMALGKDISGQPVVVDLAKMPHLLVAGSTGSGKSVGVNTMILSLLFRVTSEQVKFIMIDPKVVELSIYNDIPHLLTPVVTDMKKAANALRWCVDEMERRYLLLSALRVRNIDGYNEKIDEATAMNLPIPNPIWKPGDTMDTMPPALDKLSYIVVIVDEFADLMMVAGKQIEELIARLAQKARAVGIHLILATQRPSVDVITGLIKANIPSRIAFTVASKIDSRTILDQGGAESLLGRGDMLYSGQGSSELIRVHGAFMSDDEVARIADDWRARGQPKYIDSILDSADDENIDNIERGGEGDLDPLFDEVVEYVTSVGNVSSSSIQRRFKVGFVRAARIVDQMEEQGIVTPPASNGRRELIARRSDY